MFPFSFICLLKRGWKGFHLQKFSWEKRRRIKSYLHLSTNSLKKKNFCYQFKHFYFYFSQLNIIFSILKIYLNQLSTPFHYMSRHYQPFFFIHVNIFFPSHPLYWVVSFSNLHKFYLISWNWKYWIIICRKKNP